MTAVAYPTAPESVGDQPARQARITYEAMLACKQHSIDEHTRRCSNCHAYEPQIILAKAHRVEQERIAQAKADAAKKTKAKGKRK